MTPRPSRQTCGGCKLEISQVNFYTNLCKAQSQIEYFHVWISKLKRVWTSFAKLENDAKLCCIQTREGFRKIIQNNQRLSPFLPIYRTSTLTTRRSSMKRRRRFAPIFNVKSRPRCVPFPSEEDLLYEAYTNKGSRCARGDIKDPCDPASEEDLYYHTYKAKETKKQRKLINQSEAPVDLELTSHGLRPDLRRYFGTPSFQSEAASSRGLYKNDIYCQTDSFLATAAKPPKSCETNTTNSNSVYGRCGQLLRCFRRGKTQSAPQCKVQFDGDKESCDVFYKNERALDDEKTYVSEFSSLAMYEGSFIQQKPIRSSIATSAIRMAARIKSSVFVVTKRSKTLYVQRKCLRLVFVCIFFVIFGLLVRHFNKELYKYRRYYYFHLNN